MINKDGSCLEFSCYSLVVRGSILSGDINHTDDPLGDIKNAHVVRSSKSALLSGFTYSGGKVH